MKFLRIPIAIFLLILPILVRTLWFYQGVYVRSGNVPIPNYSSYTIPTPPLSTPVPAQQVTAGESRIILIDQSHGNNFDMADMETLTKKMVERGARIETVGSSGSSSSYSYVSSLSWQLKYASAYITVAPLSSYSSEESQLLREFVKQGGRLLVITDPTRSLSLQDYFGLSLSVSFPDIDSANALLAPYDLEFSGDYLYNMTENEGNFQNVIFQTFPPQNSLTDGLSKVILYVAHSITTKSGTPLLLSGAHTVSTRDGSDGGLAAAALDSTGNVLAIGDLTFLSPPYNQVADNPVFIDHLTDFLLGSTRIHGLADFPFVFTQPVSIIPAKDVGLSSDLLSPLHDLKSALKSSGTDAEINTDVKAGRDIIRLETYSSTGIDELLKPFQITLPDSSYSSSGEDAGKIQLPGIGAIAPSGTGLILFSHDSSKSTVILVAEDASALTDLLGVLGSAGFENCILQGDIGVCPTSSSSSSMSYWSDLYTGSMATPYYSKTTSTPTPNRGG